MRVALNAEQLLYHSPGGIGRYTAQLLAGLPAKFPGDVMLPFTARHPRASVESAFAGVGVDSAVRILGLPRPALYEGWLRFGRPRLPADLEADLVHAPSVAVPPRQGVPLVVTVHDAAPILFPDTFPRRGRRFHRTGIEVAAKRADLVLTVSNAAAAEIVDHTPIDEDRVRVVLNGVQPLEIPEDRRSHLLRSLGLSDRRYVLWVGSLEPRKGVGTVVAAIAELRRRAKAEGSSDSDVILVLAGYEGWLAQDLVDPADRAALGDLLRQMGRVTEEELWALYAGASLFLLPSEHEGFGLPMVEAMSQGTPVVASDIAAVREVAAGAACLVPPGDPRLLADAVQGLLEDDAERARLGEAGIARSEELSLDRMLSGTRSVYQEVLGA